MQLYHFRTDWHLPAGVDAVWGALRDAESWPTWTPSFRRVTILGDEQLLELGSQARVEVRGALPYTLRFTYRVTELATGRTLALESWGDIEGTGRWILEPRGRATHLTYLWDVGLTVPVLDRLGRWRATRALLSWNHDRVMAQAGRGLAARLRTQGERTGSASRDGA